MFDKQTKMAVGEGKRTKYKGRLNVRLKHRIVKVVSCKNTPGVCNRNDNSMQQYVEALMW